MHAKGNDLAIFSVHDIIELFMFSNAAFEAIMVHYDLIRDFIWPSKKLSRAGLSIIYLK